MKRTEMVLPIGKRGEAIATRFVRDKAKRPNRRVSFEMRMRAKRRHARERSERLLVEAPAWAQAVQDYGGVLEKIAMRMGYCVPTSRKVLRELGLWSAVLAAREARAHENRQSKSTC